jgi:sugar O-acyltransferase (sialic acid O-acetyltransferase NeuD family)
MQRIVILGAGGHGQVVADTLLRARDAGEPINPIGYLDDNASLRGAVFLGLPVLGDTSDLDRLAHDAVILAIGSNRTRKRLFEQLQSQGERFAIARHPSAVIAPDSQIAGAVMISARVVINTGSRVGANTILNTSCVVGHHNRIAEHVHISSGALLGGEVSVGEGALIGIGAIVMPRCTVGAWSVVGAGACVTRDVPAGITVVGVPARNPAMQGERP